MLPGGNDRVKQPYSRFVKTVAPGWPCFPPARRPCDGQNIVKWLQEAGLESDGGQVTRLLKAMHAGDTQAAENLLPLVYYKLHRLAKGYMRRERPDHTLQATALINEAYLRLVGEDIDWNSRAHFIGLAANVMRRVLVDYARGRNAEQRGGGLQRVEMQEELAISRARLYPWRA